MESIQAHLHILIKERSPLASLIHPPILAGVGFYQIACQWVQTINYDAQGWIFKHGIASSFMSNGMLNLVNLRRTQLATVCLRICVYNKTDFHLNYKAPLCTTFQQLLSLKKEPQSLREISS